MYLILDILRVFLKHHFDLFYDADIGAKVLLFQLRPVVTFGLSAVGGHFFKELLVVQVFVFLGLYALIKH